MNAMTGRLAHKFPTTLVITAFAVAAALSSPSGMAAGGTSAPTNQDRSTSRLMKTTHHKSKKMVEDAETAEARIAHLHDQLGITSAQEEAWGKIAAIMRKNAEEITTLVRARIDKSKTMTAVDDLNAYADIAGAHEDGTKKLIPAFEALYDEMPVAQQKVTDGVFRDRGHGHGLAGHAVQ